jgi:DNA polymerase-3 subunit alpha
MSAPYVPLRILSCYSILEGAIEPKAVAKQAKKLDFPAAALTDRNGLYAVMAFTDACRSEGVQPIIGALLGVARPGTPDGKPAVIDTLALYAQSERGYENLCALVSAAHLDRPLEEQPHVPFSALDGRTDGLIALTAGAGRARSRDCLPSSRPMQPARCWIGSRRCSPAGSTSSSAGAAIRSRSAPKPR